jgi:hypothetical protein
MRCEYREFYCAPWSSAPRVPLLQLPKLHAPRWSSSGPFDPALPFGLPRKGHGGGNALIGQDDFDVD